MLCASGRESLSVDTLIVKNLEAQRLAANRTVSTTPSASGLHVAVIMDGNGRWAQSRGLPRTVGHRAGVDALRTTVEAAPRLGIGTLTLYAFSSDNWRRPVAEVRALMQLLRTHLPAEAERCRENGIRLSVIGRRDRFAPSVRKAIESAETRTAGGDRLNVRIALDYSARDAIVRAAHLLAANGPAERDASGSDASGRDAFAHALGQACHADDPAPDVDLLIRTGGEQRLSDFLLWECAYAELSFTGVLWPDFDATALGDAVGAFHRRERRFGGLPEPSGDGASVLPQPQIVNVHG